MNVKPLADRVIIRPLEAETKTSGGIFIPDSAVQKPQKGEVVAAGPGKLDESGKIIPLTLKVGDTVLYGKYAGTEVTFDGQEYTIMRESDVFAVV
jgi:chaperonin GroES